MHPPYFLAIARIHGLLSSSFFCSRLTSGARLFAVVRNCRGRKTFSWIVTFDHTMHPPQFPTSFRIHAGIHVLSTIGLYLLVRSTSRYNQFPSVQIQGVRLIIGIQHLLPCSATPVSNYSCWNPCSYYYILVQLMSLSGGTINFHLSKVRE